MNDLAVPPADPIAERELATMADVSFYWRRFILAAVRPAQFTDPRWRRAIELLANPTLVSVSDVAPEYRTVSSDYCLYFGDDTRTIDQLIAAVRDVDLRRKAISAAQRIAEQAWNTDRPFNVDWARHIIDELQPARIDNPGFDLKGV